MHYYRSAIVSLFLKKSIHGDFGAEPKSTWPALIFILLCSLLLAEFWFGEIPWTPFGLVPKSLGEINADLAFVTVAPDFFLHQQQYGTEAIFTYGPLMFLSSAPIGSSYLLPYFLMRILFAALVPALFISLIKGSIAPNSVKAVLIVSLMIMGWLWFIGWDQAFWIAPIAAFVLLSTEKNRPNSYLLIVSAASLALVALIKFNFTIIAVWAVLLTSLNDVLQKRIPYPSGVFFLTLIVIWHFLGQSITNLPNWLYLSANLASGYGDAMARKFFGDYGIGVIAGLYIAAAIPVIALLAFSMPTSFRTKIQIAFFSGLSFVSIKHAFYGNQLEQAAVVLLLISYCVAIVAISNAKPLMSGRKRCLMGIGLLSGGTLASIAILIMSPHFISPPNLGVGWFENRIFSFFNFEAVHNAQQDWDRFRKSVRALAPFPELQGTTDIYPVKTAVVLAQEATSYRPRPAFLSLNAHTAELAWLNRDFLKTNRAPRNILFEVVSPDYNNRLPSTFDGPSWPEIWSRYVPRGFHNGFLSLERRPEARKYVFHKLIDTKASFGKPISLPVDPLLFATVTVKKTWLGYLAYLLYRSPHITIMIETANGQKYHHQLVPELGRAGFLISPYISTTEQFARIAVAIDGNEQSGLSNVKQISLTTEPGMKWFYQPEIRVRVQDIRFISGEPSESATKISDTLTKTWGLQFGTRECLFPPERITEGWLMHAPCVSVLPVPHKASSVSFSFGMRNTSFDGARGVSGGASFKIVGERSDGSRQILWSRDLDPASHKEDRIVKFSSISIPEGVTQVRFETDIGADESHAFDHTFWGEVNFERRP